MEPIYLTVATRPSLVFTYSYNEPFENSMLIPTKLWEKTKGKLAKHYIDNFHKLK
jgi:hypothetical protein